MFRILSLLFLTLAAFAVVEAAPVKEKKSQTLKGWGTVVDPDRDCKIVQEKDKVTITIPTTYHDLSYSNDAEKLNAPRILQEVKGDFRIQVKVQAFPLPQANTSSGGKYSFVSSGLLVWLDDKNFLRMDRAAVGGGPSPFIWVERFEDGKSVAHKQTRAEAGDIWLRIVYKEGKLAFSFSDDGDKWTEAHTEEVKLPAKVKVGVLAINTTTAEFTPVLEGLKVEKK
jgi:regulation of enolase protein 1 (concanavalin A-like superfamily)